MTLRQVTRCRPLLGTFVEVNLQADLPEKALIEYSNLAFAEIERVQQVLSFHQQSSELSQLNLALISAPTSVKKISNDLIKVLSFASDLHQESAGIYDISVAANLVADKYLPDHLIRHKNQPTYGNFSDVTLTNNRICSAKPVFFDLGGIAKGYAVDQAISKIPSSISGYINAGGDMRVIDWFEEQVAIKYARRSGALKQLTLLNTALASSGSYYQQQGSQYFNPITRQYSAIKGCISVFAGSAMQADALTKIVALMKRKDAKKLLNHYCAKAITTNRFGFSRQVN